MANPEHVEILKQGVDVWNRWREDNPDVIPDLTGADLSGAYLHHANFVKADLTIADLTSVDFSGADLRYADLSGARLSGANLSDAHLWGAKLWQADLSKAKLCSADLMQTNLSEANLSDADLSAANLCMADLYKANLGGADFSGALLIGAKLLFVSLSEANFDKTRLGYTSISNAELIDVRNLDKVWHQGPSFIDIASILTFQRQIPESFLRGCGLPEDFIQFLPSLVPIQFYSCFISYSSNDRSFVEMLYTDLKHKGVRCYFAPDHLKIGEKIRDGIDQSIGLHDKMLLILSESSIDSNWVEDEVESAFEQEQIRGTNVLFPIRLDDAVMNTGKAWASKIKRSRNFGDFRKWKDNVSYQRAFDRLMRDLKAQE